MKKLKFRENFNNKLDQKIFTTIQELTDEDSVYLGDKYVGYEVECVNETTERTHKAKCIDCEVFDSWTELPRGLLMADTGLDDLEDISGLMERFGIGVYDPVVVLTLRRCE